MDKSKKYRLKADVISHFNPGYVYAKAGTEVTILHDHINMAIIQDAAGNIFHSRTDNLADLSDPIKTITIIPEVQKQQRDHSQKKKAGPINQKKSFLNMEIPQQKFDCWCIVELFGHAKIAGRCTEQNIAGTNMLRVDVPETDTLPAFTRFFGSSAIYAINPVDEMTCKHVAGQLQVKQRGC